MNKNCISYWFPRLQAAGLQVPKTQIVKADCELSSLLDGQIPDGFEVFLAALTEAVKSIGAPCFLRTGQGSGKHQWSETCHVTDIDLLSRHVAALVEWSHLVDFMGLPHNVWAVRELLPTTPIATLPMYKGFPLTREFRFFVSDGVVICHHCYWPKKAAEEGFDYADGAAGLEVDDESPRKLPADWETAYQQMSILWPREAVELMKLASAAGKALAGNWSVDILETKRGWYITDVAEAARSFHWDGCPKAGMLK